MEMGIISKEVNPIKLLIENQPYMLIRKFGEMSPYERDICRAGEVRKELEVFN